MERWMQLAILSSKPYPNVIPGFVAYLIKDNALSLSQRKGDIVRFFTLKFKGSDLC